MTLPGVREIDPVIPATWPPLRRWTQGAITLSEGAGGGQRVSAATVEGTPGDDELSWAEIEMRALNQTPLFRIREGQDALDARLGARGYILRDPTNIYAGPIGPLAEMVVPPVSAFQIWPPLSIMKDLWDAGGINRPRQAVMARVTGPKMGVLGRANDQPAGVSFVAIKGKFAMIHAVEVVPALRRRKVAQHMMGTAAQWAQDMGAQWMTVLCTCHNLAANTLYTSLGLTNMGRYHYRALKNPGE